MEGIESKLPTQQEDTQISPEIFAATIENCQESVRSILEQIEQDGKFSDMTAEYYDKKKSYLKRHLTELSPLLRILANQHVRLIGEVSTDALKVKETKDDVLKVVETKDPEVLLLNNFRLKAELASLKKELQRSAQENDDLKRAIEKSRIDCELSAREAKLAREIKTKQLHESKEQVWKINCDLIQTRAKMARYETEILQLRSKRNQIVDDSD